MAIIPNPVQTLLFLFCLVSPITTPTTVDAAAGTAEADALLRLKSSFINPAPLVSWQPGTEPCAWFGVRCDDGVITGLHLGHLGLKGNINVDALTSLPGLRSISFMSNAFSGQIPEFGRIGALKGLYISENRFSGIIPPDYFSNMASLKKVWLSDNNFSGSVPASIKDLRQLMELHVENNRFSGGIPSLEQKTLVSLNFSNNNLEGEIPPALSRFSADLFAGNPGLCGGKSGRICTPPLPPPPPSPLPPPPPPPPPPQPPAPVKRGRSSSNAFKIALWFVLTIVVLFAVIVAVIFAMRSRNKGGEMPAMENLVQPVAPAPNAVKKVDDSNSKKAMRMSTSGGSSRRRDIVIINDEKGLFGLADLMKSAAEVLGNGALGSSYKATMVGGLTVVVKRMKELIRMGREQFDAEMRRLGRLRHKNILTPLAYHYRKDEKLLVSEYQPRGSLLFVLHGDRGVTHSELSWAVRLKIVQGIGRGLGYLHTELSSLELPHGDLKSSNILLTSEYDPLLVDYGFCSLISKSHGVQALTAYKAPEAILHQEISPKCDVYCLGILILEILTGKFPSQYSNNSQGGTDVVQWVRSAIAERREADLLDPDISMQGTSSVSAMVQLIRIGASCTEDNPMQRLDLREAIKRIEGICVDGAETINIEPSDGDSSQSPSVADQIPSFKASRVTFKDGV